MPLLIDECVDERLRLLFRAAIAMIPALSSKVNSVTRSTPNTQPSTH
jgi:hypothetical protein